MLVLVVLQMPITTDLATDIGQVRFYIGDDTDDTASATPTRGILPNGANYTDAQIQFFLDGEGGDVMRACAAAYENLAVRFAQLVSLAEGARNESLSDIQERYDKLAKEYRTKYGGVASGGNTFATALGRRDGYSDAAGRTGTAVGEFSA